MNYEILAYTYERSYSAGSAAGAGASLFLNGLMGLVSIAILVGIVLFLQKILSRVPAEHRKIEPNALWLLVIPCFNLYWNFVAFQKIAESFKSYYDSIGRTDVGDCGKQLALIAAICYATLCGSFIGLVLVIVLIVKWNGYKDQIPAA